ncbi:MAG: hypothetical protein FRX49_00978 [Trebouxia sp. A1-2]|nr:MAG: hypothetical protein FRX49_00978 [Trebouxia sp. A1-2]
MDMVPAPVTGYASAGNRAQKALSEALYLFQCRSSLPQAGNTVNHCLIFSLTEAHNMAIDWPYPLVPASSDQGCQTASFSVGMAEAFRQQGISLSILSTYPPGQSNPVWPSLLYKLFEHAEQKAKTQDEQQKQQQQRLKLRDQCSVGLQSGHFALLSRQWGEAVQSFQGQRSKRKAAQAFEDAPVNGYHKQTKAEPQGSDGQSFPFQSAVPSKVPIVPVPKAGSTLPDWQTSPFSVAALPRPSAGPPNPAPALSQGSNQASASHDSSPAVDLTSPNMKPRVAEPGVLDLTEEKTELKHRQEQAQRLNQGHPGARQVVDAGPGPSQPGSQQDQGKLGTALGQRQQGHAQRALPQSMPGQAPAALGQVIAGQPPVPLLQSQHNAVVSPATSSTASARPSASQQGMPTVMWQGKVFAAAAVVKRPQDVLMLECRLGVQRATWPPGLEQGWGQHLVVNKLVPLADITKLVGQEVLSQAPRVGLALGPITEWGMSFLKDMAAKKVMAIVQLPHRGKFLGLITAPSSSSPAQVPQKLIGLVLTLHINQQPKQQ